MAMVLLAAAGPVRAQDWSLEPRIGITAGGALFRDAAVEGFEPVDVAPAPGPVLGLLARTAVRPKWTFELELAWAPGTLQASGPERDRELSDLRVLTGTARLRRALGPVFGALGIGAVSYHAPDARAYSEGASLFPALSAALAVPLSLGSLRSHVEAGLLTHRHQTPVLERAGADAALAWRASLVLGIELGGAR